MRNIKAFFSKVSTKMAQISALFLLMSQSAFASTSSGGDPTFDSLVQLFLGYLEGSYGLAISLASVVIGAIAALVQQSLMFLAFGVGLAIGFIYVPTILANFFTAVLPF